MKKNLIIAGFNNRNLGDDLMFASVVNTLKYNEYYFYGPPIKPAFVDKAIQFLKYGRATVLRWKFFADFAYVGGSLFMGENDAQLSMFEPKKRLLKRNKRFGGKNYVLGANLGPYRDKAEYVRHLQEIVALVDCWKVRDEYSYALLKELNARNVTLIPDIVMGFDVSRYTSVTPIKQVAISVTHVDKDGAVDSNQSRFEDEIVFLINQYHDAGYAIALLSFEDNTDLPIMQRISDRVGADKSIQLITNQEDAVLGVIAKSEIVISTRFHCMVLSALMKKNQIIYQYSQKTANFAQKYGFEVHEISGDATNKKPAMTTFSDEDVNSAQALFSSTGYLK